VKAWWQRATVVTIGVATLAATMREGTGVKTPAVAATP